MRSAVKIKRVPKDIECDSLWNSAQVSKFMNWHIVTVRRKSEDGLIPGASKIEGRWRYKPADLQRWVDAKKTVR